MSARSRSSWCARPDGSVKAFYNICQHRGNPLVSGEKGSVRRFVCRYHSWAFMPDGELNFAPDAADFPQGNPCGKVRLEELACETFAGFVWVNMNPDCVSLKEFLGPIWDDWSLYDLHTWKRYVAKTTTLPCNWKVVLDNFNESYHVPTVHMAATPKTDRSKIQGTVKTNYKETRFDLSEEGHNRMIMQGGFGVGATDKEGNILEPLASELRQWELDPADFKDRPEDTRLALQAAKRKIGPGRGYSHYEKIPLEQFTDAFHYTLFPNFAVSIWADGFHFPARTAASNGSRAVRVRQLVVLQPARGRNGPGQHHDGPAGSRPGSRARSVRAGARRPWVKPSTRTSRYSCGSRRRSALAATRGFTCRVRRVA